MEVDNGLAGLLASIGLLVASVAELLVSGYSCLTLTPKLCGCLRTSTTDEMMIDGNLKTSNMVHQWVVTQNHMPPKNQQPPLYVVHPMPVPIHPMMQVSVFGLLSHNFNSYSLSNYSLLGQDNSKSATLVPFFFLFFILFSISLFFLFYPSCSPLDFFILLCTLYFLPILS